MAVPSSPTLAVAASVRSSWALARSTAVFARANSACWSDLVSRPSVAASPSTRVNRTARYTPAPASTAKLTAAISAAIAVRLIGRPLGYQGRAHPARAHGKTWDRSLLFPTAGPARRGVRAVHAPARPAVIVRMQDLADKPCPFGETGLHAVTRGLIVRPAVDRVRGVLLADDALRPVVRV